MLRHFRSETNSRKQKGTIMRRHRFARRNAAFLAAFVILISCLFAGGNGISLAEEGPEDPMITEENAPGYGAENGEDPENEEGSETEDLALAAAKTKIPEEEETKAQEVRAAETSEVETNEEEVSTAEAGEAEANETEAGETEVPEEEVKEEEKNEAEADITKETPGAEDEFNELDENDDFRSEIGLNRYFREHLDPAYVPGKNLSIFWMSA